MDSSKKIQLNKGLSTTINIDNYPPATNNIDKNCYRLNEYLDYEDYELEIVENALWDVVNARVAKYHPIKKYKDYVFLSSGWEFSVFHDTSKTEVIKIPAGIFPEVNTRTYFQNISRQYELIRSYVGESLVAKSEIDVENRVIHQEFLKGRHITSVGYNTKNKKFIRNLIQLIDGLRKLGSDYRWLPDINIQRKKGGFNITNVIKIDDRPVLYDFSSYYDVFRMYPKRTDLELKWKGESISDFSSWLHKRSDSSEDDSL